MTTQPPPSPNVFWPKLGTGKVNHRELQTMVQPGK